MKKYASDYRRSEDGYEYSGSRYRILASTEELRKKAGADMVCMAAASLLFLLGVFQNNAGTRVLWILLPFVGTFLPIAYGWMGAWALVSFQKGERGREGWMRRMDYDHCIRRPWRCGILLILLSAVASGGELVLMLTGGGRIDLRKEALFLAAAAGLLLVGSFYFVQSRKLEKKAEKCQTGTE